MKQPMNQDRVVSIGRNVTIRMFSFWDGEGDTYFVVAERRQCSKSIKFDDFTAARKRFRSEVIEALDRVYK